MMLQCRVDTWKILHQHLVSGIRIFKTHGNTLSLFTECFTLSMKQWLAVSWSETSHLWAGWHGVLTYRDWCKMILLITLFLHCLPISWIFSCCVLLSTIFRTVCGFRNIFPPHWCVFVASLCWVSQIFLISLISSLLRIFGLVTVTVTEIHSSTKKICSQRSHAV